MDSNFTSGIRTNPTLPKLLSTSILQAGLWVLLANSIIILMVKRTARTSSTYDKVVMKKKAEEEKADSLVPYLDGQAFEYFSTI